MSDCHIIRSQVNFPLFKKKNLILISDNMRENYIKSTEKSKTFVKLIYLLSWFVLKLIES
jgi:hypothetical protein